MSTDYKWLNTRLPEDLKARYSHALNLAKKQTGHHIASPMVIVPAVKKFCEAAEAGTAKEFLQSN